VAEVLSGPPAYANWRALQAAAPCLATEEYPLFTDAWIVGETTQGPYQFLNTVPQWEPALIQPAIVLRINRHTDFDHITAQDMEKTNTDRYHAGSFPEEVAALASLAMGIRLKAGGITRRFEPNGDPKGRPSEWGARPFTNFILHKNPSGWVLASGAEGTHPLNQLEVLTNLPRLSTLNAIALVRAARLYQEALWLVESEPELSWLMLVSAIETAANQWRRTKESSVARLKASKPELYEYLAGIGRDVAVKVAEQIADSLGSTRKFVDFILCFLPTAPSARPAEWWQHPWDEPRISKSMQIIYNYRSKALHEGRPFPAPMCAVPTRFTEWLAPAEIPGGMATAVAGGIWLAKDTPMLLHTFEYIVRGVLLEWWKQGAPLDTRDEG